MPDALRALDETAFATAARDGDPVKVAVLVDLELEDDAGGHVKCWEQFAHAARELPDQLDLTIHFLGEAAAVVPLAGNVRYQVHRPAFGTHRLPFLNAAVDHTDLAWRHRGLARMLDRYDVLHATDIFAMGRTALRYSQGNGVPLVSSLHTDLVTFTRVYGAQIMRSWARNAFVQRLLVETLDLPGRSAAVIQRLLDAFLAHSDHVLLSAADDRDRVLRFLPPDRISTLRRGIDREQFDPARRDRSWLQQTLGVPADVPLLLFVGRVDDSKGVLLLARAARQLLDQGTPLHALVIGAGDRRDDVAAILGDAATVPGWLQPDIVARAHACADLFVFPSLSDVAPNVVLEAKASGVPVVVSSTGGGADFVGRDGVDGRVLASREVADWAAALGALLHAEAQRRIIGTAARHWVETQWPTWRQVLEQDLVPVWRRLAGKEEEAAAAPVRMVQRA